MTLKNQDLLEFNYMISHNVRSPLSNIIGLISLLEMDPNIKNHVGYDLFHEIKNSAKRLDDTLHDLNSILDLRKHESKKKLQKSRFYYSGESKRRGSAAHK